jgi:hypothetical protein
MTGWFRRAKGAAAQSLSPPKFITVSRSSLYLMNPSSDRNENQRSDFAGAGVTGIGEVMRKRIPRIGMLESTGILREAASAGALFRAGSAWPGRVMRNSCPTRGRSERKGTPCEEPGATGSRSGEVFGEGVAGTPSGGVPTGSMSRPSDASLGGRVGSAGTPMESAGAAVGSTSSTSRERTRGSAEASPGLGSA